MGECTAGVYHGKSSLLAEPALLPPATPPALLHPAMYPLPPQPQVRFQLERAQEGLQRQLLHAEGGIGVLEARLADAQSGGLGRM